MGKKNENKDIIHIKSIIIFFFRFKKLILQRQLLFITIYPYTQQKREEYV